MKKFYLFLISVFILVGCGDKSDDPVVVPEDSGRTVLAYFFTTQLSTALQNNIVTMFEGLQKCDNASTLLIYWDNGYKLFTSPSVLKFTADGKGAVNGISQSEYTSESGSSSTSKVNYILSKADIVKSYPADQVSTDKDVMTTVLDDMMNLSKTKEYGLIFGSHASSWLPSTSARAIASANSAPMEIPDLNEALLNTGKKFKYIIMDACMMGSVEVVYELRSTCDYYIASPMEVPTVGFPYSDIMTSLYSDDVSDYTTEVCDRYSSFQTEQGLWGNCIVVDCSQVAVLADEIMKSISGYSPINLSSVQSYVIGSFSGSSYDIEDFMNRYTDGNISSSLKSQLDKTIISKSFVKTTYGSYPSFQNKDTSGLCGMGMYVPQAGKSSWNSYIKVLLWGEASGWSGYINSL